MVAPAVWYGGAMAVSAIGGIMSNRTARAGQRDMARALQAQAKAMQDNLAFQKEKYARWESVYGDIQTNLGKYYENLGPARLASFGLQEQQQAYEQNKVQLERNLAQRGLSNSALGAYTENQLDFANNRARAGIRANAPEQVRAQQMNFLGQGLNQQQAHLQGVSNAANIATQGYGQAAGFHQGIFNNSQALTHGYISQIGGGLNYQAARGYGTVPLAQAPYTNNNSGLYINPQNDGWGLYANNG